MAKKTSTSAVTDAAIKKSYQEYSKSKQGLDDLRMAHASLAQRIDERGIHRGSMKLVHKLLKMDVAKAQDFMRSFERYAEVLGLDAKLESQPELPANDQPEVLETSEEGAAQFH